MKEEKCVLYDVEVFGISLLVDGSMRSKERERGTLKKEEEDVARD